MLPLASPRQKRILSMVTMLIMMVTVPLLLSTSVYAQAGSPRTANDTKSDYSRITTVPRREVDAWLKQQMRTSGADPTRGRYRFVLGFSTGHYAADPVQAIATRRIAFGLLNNTLTPGDHVTPVAWEMAVWDIKPDITLTGEPDSREAVVNTFPYTPAQNSTGGHDTERALSDVLTRAVPAKDASATIILLFTNSGQSQVGSGSVAQLFGQANPKFVKQMNELGYRAPERTAFTTRTSGIGDSVGEVPVHVIGLFPKQLKPLSGADSDAPRYPTFSIASWRPNADHPTSVSELPNPTVLDATPKPTLPEKRQTDRSANFWPYLLGTLVLGGILFAISRIRSKGEIATPGRSTKPDTSKTSGDPIPGRFIVTLGVGNEGQMVTSLRTIQSWNIEAPIATSDATALASPSGFTLSETKPSAQAVTGTKLSIATLAFERAIDRKTWHLVCSATNSYQFAKIIAKDVDQSDVRRLRVLPGGDFRADLIHASDSTAPKLTIKVRYEVS